MELTSLVLALCLLFNHALAHAGDHYVPHSELARRSNLSKRCAGAAAALNQKRYERRMKRKRGLDKPSGNTTYEIVTEAPYYEVLQNDTCVLSPEVTQGPYVWPRSQLLRQDMSEDQPGVPLWLDIGVLDMATCEPLPGALVSLWHCNATGSYSSFTGQSPNTPFLELLDQLNVTNFTIGSTDIHTDDSTWLRGMWPTDKHGMMEMRTVFPGFYIERTIHIHTQVFTNWTVRENGTISTGNRISTGQLYFDEAIEQRIMANEPYSWHTEIERTLNSNDILFGNSTVGGYNPVVDIVPADGVNIEEGMIGYITIGVDTSDIDTGDVGLNS